MKKNQVILIVIVILIGTFCLFLPLVSAFTNRMDLIKSQVIVENTIHYTDGTSHTIETKFLFETFNNIPQKQVSHVSLNAYIILNWDTEDHVSLYSTVLDESAKFLIGSHSIYGSVTIPSWSPLTVETTDKNEQFRYFSYDASPISWIFSGVSPTAYNKYAEINFRVNLVMEWGESSTDITIQQKIVFQFDVNAEGELVPSSVDINTYETPNVVKNPETMVAHSHNFLEYLGIYWLPLVLVGIGLIAFMGIYLMKKRR